MSMTLNPSTASVVNASLRLTGKTPFELNSDAFGPVAASAIGLAQVAADTAGATVNFSEQALQSLSNTAHGAVAAVEGAASDVGSAVSAAYHSVADAGSGAASAVGRAASSLYNAIGDVADTTTSYAAIGAQAVGAALV